MDVDDIETTIETTEEKAIVEKFNPAIFRAETITKMESHNPFFLEEEDDSLTCLLVFPSYDFNDKEYIDVQHLFGLREDFALACLANWGEFDEGFVDNSPCPLAILDTKGGDEFIEKEKAAIMCTKMIEEYEKCGLPIEEEFKKIQESLGISDMEYEGKNSKLELPQMDKNKSSIDLYNHAVYDLNETPQISQSVILNINILL